MAEEAAKNVVPPPSPNQRPRRTDQTAGKKVRNPLKAKAPCKMAPSGGATQQKPRCNWEMVALREICRFQKSGFTDTVAVISMISV